MFLFPETYLISQVWQTILLDGFQLDKSRQRSDVNVIYISGENNRVNKTVSLLILKTSS
jgi:hypothetical protein